MKQLIGNMQILVLFIIMNICLLKHGISQHLLEIKTEIENSIFADEKWLIEGSPYFITQSISIHSGVTLTLDPGVVVGVKAGATIWVEGTLIASGTRENPVVFTGGLFPSFSEPIPWNGIVVSGPFASVNLKNFKGHFAQTFLNLQQTGSREIKISEGTLSHNVTAMRWGQINAKWEMAGTAIIENESGIILQPNFSSSVKGIMENYFCGNAGYALKNRSPLSFELAQNCWCESDNPSLDRAIFDEEDSMGVGAIFLNPSPKGCEENFQDRFSVGGVTVVLDEDIGTGNDKELLVSQVRIFPVPTKDIIEIEYPDIEVERLIISDLAGRVLFDITALPDDGIRLSMQGYDPNIYVLTLISPIGILTKKIEVSP